MTNTRVPNVGSAHLTEFTSEGGQPVFFKTLIALFLLYLKFWGPSDICQRYHQMKDDRRTARTLVTQIHRQNHLFSIVNLLVNNMSYFFCVPSEKNNQRNT